MLLSTVIVSVDDPEPPATLLALRTGLRPALGTVGVKVTVLVNPLTGATVMVDVPELPAWIVSVMGLAVIVKLGTDDVMMKVMA